MSEGDPIRSEVTPAYRTLDEPTKLIGLSMSQWGAVALAGALPTGGCWSRRFLALERLVIVIFGGAPMVLPCSASRARFRPRKLFRAVCRWRVKPALLLAVEAELPPTGGVVVLDEAPADIGGRAGRGAPLARSRGEAMSTAEPALELAEERRRVDDLARVLPLAAIEPDGLAITSDGTYVRVIEADHVCSRGAAISTIACDCASG